MDDKGGDWSAPRDPRADARGDGEALAARLEHAVRERGLELDEMGRERLREAAANAEAEVARNSVAEANLPFLCATDEGPVHLKFRWERTPRSFHLDVSFEGATPQQKPSKRSPMRMSKADLDGMDLKSGEREVFERMLEQRDNPAKSTVPVLVMILAGSTLFLVSVLLAVFLSL